MHKMTWLILICGLCSCSPQTVNTGANDNEGSAVSNRLIPELSSEANELVMNGAAVFDSQGCATCHGPAGSGGGVWIENAVDPHPPALSPAATYFGLTRYQTLRAIESLSSSIAPESPALAEAYEDYRLQIADGGHPPMLSSSHDGPIAMPSYAAALTDRQVDALLAYLLSLSLQPERIALR